MNAWQGVVSKLYTPIVLILAVLMWWAVVRVFDIQSYVLPSPGVVWDSAVQNRGLLAHGLLSTLGEALLGFGVGMVVGLPLGIAIVLWRPIERTVYPFIIMLESTPKIALAPLLVIWLGIGVQTRIAQAFIVVFFPIMINTALGLRSASPEVVTMTRSMGASTLQVFQKIRLPAALPSIFGGFKVALPLAVVGAIVAEFVGGSSGLGALLLAASGAFLTGLVFATLVVLSLMGIALFRLVEFMEWLVLGEGRRKRHLYMKARSQRSAVQNAGVTVP